jgi:hypothetical protein
MDITNPDYDISGAGAGLFEGLTFVVTGTMARPRKEVESLRFTAISALGYFCRTTVRLHLLLAGS